MVRLGPKPRAALDFSGATVADGYLISFHQHRHLAGAAGDLQHFFHALGIVNHIFVGDAIPFLGFGLPGLLGEGSTVLTVDDDFW
jgi:hypothetical protein